VTTPLDKNLRKFLKAQDDGSFRRAVVEMSDGIKRSHWMWYVFPQIAGLGRSERAKHFAIRDADEARRYLNSPLGARLVQLTAIVLANPRPAIQIFGPIDSPKFRSCMTLFEAVATDETVFTEALNRFYKGKRCTFTVNALGADPPPA